MHIHILNMQINVYVYNSMNIHEVGTELLLVLAVSRAVVHSPNVLLDKTDVVTLLPLKICVYWLKQKLLDLLMNWTHISWSINEVGKGVQRERLKQIKLNLKINCLRYFWYQIFSKNVNFIDLKEWTYTFIIYMYFQFHSGKLNTV